MQIKGSNTQAPKGCVFHNVEDIVYDEDEDEMIEEQKLSCPNCSIDLATPAMQTTCLQCKKESCVVCTRACTVCNQGPLCIKCVGTNNHDCGKRQLLIAAVDKLRAEQDVKYNSEMQAQLASSSSAMRNEYERELAQFNAARQSQQHTELQTVISAAEARAKADQDHVRSLQHALHHEAAKQGDLQRQLHAETAAAYHNAAAHAPPAPAAPNEA